MDDSPTYRVNFWERYGNESWSLEAFVLSDAEDVREVLEWALEHANGRRIELFVEIEVEPFTSFSAPRKTDLLRLYGSDPTEGDTSFTFITEPLDD
ncbi:MULTISPECIES: hypothetical protein [unclassified Brevibacterium]|uniref:hypothetical protein n=1 Tax=unclassified Brevibacterium TaxID=2614124 RepID=UPI001E421F6B|nr:MULTISPECIES: hypothetical protein [unclassified Brevibacterium]MCD1285735.1 hypothetical protein [Brevibacterium sp. CCUG 69071]MDK8434793.1 hypothetical protein [Brevibacterium sp. H-BE7]